MAMLLIKEMLLIIFDIILNCMDDDITEKVYKKLRTKSTYLYV